MHFSNINISDKALSTLRRRVETLEEKKGVGQKTTRYLGFRLSQIFLRYLPEAQNRLYEKGIFMSFVIGLLRDLGDMASGPLPKNFLMAPAQSIRRCIREGPKITNGKRGEKKNLYIPLSYVKSSECEHFPDALRRECTNVGSKVLEVIDSANNLPLVEIDSKIPIYQRFLRFAYGLSDEIRHEWRTNAFVPTSGAISRAVESVLTPVEFKENNQTVTMPIDIPQDELTRRVRNVVFAPVCPDTERLKSIKSNIQVILKNKRSRRQKAKASSA
jgi:hypothetical protein